MTTWTSSDYRPGHQLPADELGTVLRGLRDQLAALTAGDCASHPLGIAPCLDRLYRYLVDELTPILRAVHVRIRPGLRRLDVIGDGWRSAAGTAALLRLTERVALLRAEYELSGSDSGKRAEIAEVTHQLAERAAAHLAFEQQTLPVLLRTLPTDDAQRIVDAARRTARAAARAPRPDLRPAAL